TFGQPVTFVARVTPEAGAGAVLPTGLVTFLDGGTPIGTAAVLNSGGLYTATFITGGTDLAAGTHTISAIYDAAAADPTLKGSTSGTLTQTVKKASTTTTIPGSSPAPLSFGQAVTFTITITPMQGTVLPTGTVTLKEGATILGTSTTITNVSGTPTA